MANLGALNKLLNFQKVLISLHCQHYLSASASRSQSYSVAADLMRTQRTTQASRSNSISSSSPSSSIQATFLQQRFYCSNRESCPPSNSSTPNTTTVKISPVIGAPPASIDEFRAREEQREQEFARKQAADEAAQLNAGAKDEDEAKRQKVEAIRRKILAAALPHVPTLGWTRNAIVQGAEDAGLPSVMHGMFPEGGFALVSYFNGQCNEKLVNRLQQATSQNSQQSDHVDFLQRAVRERIEMLIPYKAQWPQALALIALPQNASTALAQVLTLVDDICYYAGDRSVDIGWYTRRIGLATIMKLTELYMLQDTSPDHAKTWKFLKNRMDEAVQLQAILSQSENMTNKLQHSFNSAFITARNILGLGYNR